jgi:hypothetical protein
MPGKQYVLGLLFSYARGWLHAGLPQHVSFSPADHAVLCAGDVGAPQQHPWELGLTFTASFQDQQAAAETAGAAVGAGAHGCVRVQRRFLPYPQPLALLPALQQAEVWLLGKMLAVVGPATQLQVLEQLTAAVSAKAVSKKDANSIR